MLIGDASFGVRTNLPGFNIAWASGRVVVVGISTTPTNPNWSPVSTNTLIGGTSSFSDSPTAEVNFEESPRHRASSLNSLRRV